MNMPNKTYAILQEPGPKPATLRDLSNTTDVQQCNRPAVSISGSDYKRRGANWSNGPFLTINLYHFLENYNSPIQSPFKINGLRLSLLDEEVDKRKHTSCL